MDAAHDEWPSVWPRLPTAAKLLLILTAVLLPIGIALAWLGKTGIRQADAALEGRNRGPVARSPRRSIESLIARNALALRIAANGALADGRDGACERTQRSLTDRARSCAELRTRKRRREADLHRRNVGRHG